VRFRAGIGARNANVAQQPIDQFEERKPLEAALSEKRRAIDCGVQECTPPNRWPFRRNEADRRNSDGDCC
jgi:hypothetical protein